jgi:hypothetical protein
MLTLFLGSPFEVFNVSLESLWARKVFLILFFDVVTSLQKGCFLSGNLTFNKLLVIILRNRRYPLLETVYFFMLALLYKDFIGVKLKNIESMRFLYQKARDPTLHQTNLTAPAVHRVARLLQAYSRVVCLLRRYFSGL